MTSLWLPAPTRTVPPPPSASSSSRSPAAASSTALATTSSTQPPRQQQQPTKKAAAPTYEQRCQRALEHSRLPKEQRSRLPPLFVPRSLKDFDDGGAFPEIHVAQYPRHMGNPHLKKKPVTKGAGKGGRNVPAGALSTSRELLNVEIDAKGEVSYDAIVTGGTNADKKVYARHDDLRGTTPSAEDIALPTQTEEESTTARTAAALNSLIASKTAQDKPTGSAMIQAATSANIEEKTQFIKYKPRPDAPGYNPAAKERVIQMVPAQVDPMMPPKHKHKKAPRGPAEDPVPVLHAPPEKLSKEEREAWNIPACISNWKNTRGYTIPLDKRLAADGRGLREQSINSNFATLSESLYVAERQAREEVRMRAQVQKRLAVQEKERREEELRELANKARMERAGAGVAAVNASAGVGSSGHEGTSTPLHPPQGGARQVSDDRRNTNTDSAVPAGETLHKPPTEEEVAAQQRDRLRIERKKERERELRLERHRGSGNDDEEDAKRRRLESERDVSEKIALGVHTGTGGLGGEVDSRLYNQNAGMDSGFGAEDEYNTYTQPLFNRDGVSSSSIYKPTRGEQNTMDGDEQYDKLVKTGTSKFQPDKGFAGAEGGGQGGGVGSGNARTAPVQFEKGKD